MPEVRRDRKVLIWWIAALVWMAVIFYFSSKPASAVLKLLPDYVFHFIEYAILAWLLFEAWLNLGKQWSLKKVSFITFFIVVWYAVTDEFHQVFVPTRDASLSDLVADWLAALVIISVAVIYTRKKSKKIPK